jgi:hypothetical protein
MPKKSYSQNFEELQSVPPGPIPSANITNQESETTRPIPTPTPSKKKVAIPKFKTLLKMIKKSESQQIYVKDRINQTLKQNNGLFSSSRDSFDYNATQDTLNTQRQKLSKQDILIPNIESVKSHRILNYRNLLKTTRENFKRNLIDYMNKRHDDKRVKNTGYRFPILNSRSTFRTVEPCVEDEEKLHVNDYADAFQENKLVSNSLPNLNTYYSFNKQKDKENQEFKLPSVTQTKEPFVAEQSLKDDSIFWSKYKRTITRQIKYAQDATVPNGVSTRMASNFTNRIASISEEEQVNNFDNKYTKSVGEVFYSEPQEQHDRHKSSSIALTETNLKKLKTKANKSSLSADIRLSTIYDRRQEVAVK